MTVRIRATPMKPKTGFARLMAPNGAVPRTTEQGIGGSTPKGTLHLSFQKYVTNALDRRPANPAK
jgi:hypothetical protein